MKNNFSEFSEVLKAAIEFGGKEILKDKRKTNNYLEDLAPGSKFQKEKKLLNDAYSCNAVNILLDADASPDRHKKAAESAKSKLIDSMSLSESGSEMILKEICKALGWNTQQLFNSSSSQEKVQPAIPKENKNVSLNKEYYNQPVIDAEPINNNKPVVYSNQVPITAKAQTAKKKSPFGTVLKIATVIIVICVIYNLGKNDGGSDTVIIDETQATVTESTFSEIYSETAAATTAEAVTTTEPANNEAFTIAASEQAYNENAAEAALIVSDPTAETTSETTMPVTTTQEVTTTADPRAGKYVVTDIARFELDTYAFDYDTFMTYDSNEDTVYYITNTGDVHKYDLFDKSDNIVLTLKDIEDIFTGNSSGENSLLNNDEKYVKFKIEGVVVNRYNNKLYVFGYAQGSDYYGTTTFMYDIADKNLLKYRVINSFYSVAFINEDEFFAAIRNYNWLYVNLSTGEEKRVNSIGFYRIVDVNDNYYNIMSDGEVKKFRNIYTGKIDDLFSKKMAGADEKDNTLYFLDRENNVYKIDLDNLTEELYISVDDIFQNGKQFLGKGECSGLYMTNDGGFITYDKSDSKLKYVSMNK